MEEGQSTRTPASLSVASRIRPVLTVVGAAALIGGAFMHWIGFTRGVGLTYLALWPPTPGFTNSGFLTSAGFVMIVLAILGLAGLAWRTGLITGLAGGLAVVAFVLLLAQTSRSTASIADLKVGPWLCLLGGTLFVAAGFIRRA